MASILLEREVSQTAWCFGYLSAEGPKMHVLDGLDRPCRSFVDVHVRSDWKQDPWRSADAPNDGRVVISNLESL